jgi:membrane-associated protease RseP (regulator of RpoE activity)
MARFPSGFRGHCCRVICAVIASGCAGAAPVRAVAAQIAESVLVEPTVPGTGWLGMKVGASPEPGRWIVTELAADGPAAVAGIRVNDEIRAMHGRDLASLDEVAQAVTAVAAGQQVPIAAAREGRPLEFVLVAQPRPTRPGTPPLAAGAAGAGVVPAAGTDSGDRYPQPVPGSRFGGGAAAPANPALPVAPLRSSPDAASRPVVDAAPARPFDTPAPTGPANWGAVQPGPTVAPRTVAPRAVAPSSRAPAAFPGTNPVAGSRSRGRTALGVRTVPIDAPTQARFRLPRPSGAYVIGVVGELPAWKAGVPAGSVIVALGEQPVNSPEELTQLVASGPVDRPLPIQYVLPGGEQKRAEVVLQSLDLPLERALVGPGTETGPPPAVRRSERPLAPADDATAPGLHDEVRRLRERIDWLERRLNALEPRTP